MEIDTDILLKILNGITDLCQDVKHLIKRMNHKQPSPNPSTTVQPKNFVRSDSPPETSSIEHPHSRLNRTHIFNRSKFLDIKDHDRLIQYVSAKDVIDAVSNVEPHKRISLLRKLIFDNLNLSISMYMTQKLLNTHMTINVPPSETTLTPEVEIDTIDF